MTIYDIGVADIVIGSWVSAADAERIVTVTGMQPRHEPQPTADRLNSAVARAIGDTGVALAAPASKQRTRARRLRSELGQVLQLMALDPERIPAEGGDFAAAYQVLLPGGESDALLAECARLGFSSPKEAIWQGMRGLWLFQRLAATAVAHWEAHPEKTKHKPDPRVMAWVSAMAETYPAVVDAKVPKAPTTESPFIKFCEEIRVHLLGRLPASGEPVLDAFRGTLKRVRPAAMAAFVTRHLKSES